MRTITEEDFSREYLIYKTLTPDKEYKTYIAMRENAEGNPFAVILKELSEKRVSIYQELSHLWNPYIANTYDIFEVISSIDRQSKRYIAVTEYVTAAGCDDAESLSLARFVQRNGCLQERTALYIAMQCCEGLKDFHKKGLVHRDIKPENIMISEYDPHFPKIKIVDFGGGKQVNPAHLSDTTVIGTLGFRAPESVSSGTTNRSDIYSIGCLLHFMLTGQEPGLNRYQGNHYLVSIIEKAISTDPYNRYASVTAMKKQMEHEFGTRWIDRIPLLRTVPGFRTHTLWKEIIAGIIYSSLILIFHITLDMFGVLGVFDLFTFYIVIPLVIGFNWGNLLRFFPESLRNNRSMFFLARTLIILASVFAPMFVDPLLGGA